MAEKTLAERAAEIMKLRSLQEPLALNVDPYDMADLIRDQHQALCAAEDAQAYDAKVMRDQAARIAELENDAARLDSGMIETSERDEFGTDYVCIRKGLNLRTAID
ncbi:MAG: hypothetical protein ACREVL_14595, partial [Solimonas sp.]